MSVLVVTLARFFRATHRWCMLVLLVSCFAPEFAWSQTNAGTRIAAKAEAIYQPHGYNALLERSYSNEVVVIVGIAEAMALTPGAEVRRPPNTAFQLSHLLSNTGNVRSAYTFELTSLPSAYCAGANTQLQNLSLVHDVNGNGIADPGERTLPLDNPGSAELNPGESLPFLILGRTPASSNALACVQTTVSTSIDRIVHAVTDRIAVGGGASLNLFERADRQYVLPGEVVAYSVRASNVGSEDAAPTAVVGGSLGSGPITASCLSAGEAVVLMRQPISAGASYVPGSLSFSGTASARRLLYRVAGDRPFAYRCMSAGDNGAGAEEVAVALLGSIPADVSVELGFSLRADGSRERIDHRSQSVYHNGVSVVADDSNAVSIPVLKGMIGVATDAEVPVEHGDGTLSVGLTVHVKNYGVSWLYAPSLALQLAGTTGGAFGNFTTQEVPGPGEYAIVAGSLRLERAPVGSTIALDSAFSGGGARAELLNRQSFLAPGQELQIALRIRYNTAGRDSADLTCTVGGASLPDTLCVQPQVRGALLPDGAEKVGDLSVNGRDPDPDGDGNPGNNASPTPINARTTGLKVSKSVVDIEKLAAGRYRIDYLVGVSNTGSVPASNVRVIDSLACAFGPGAARGAIESWRLLGTPVARHGVLAVSPRYTGGAFCNRSQWDAISSGSLQPAQVPTELALSLSDGTRGLAVGESEEFAFSVEVSLPPGNAQRAIEVTNKAVAAAFSQNGVNLGQITGAAGASMVSLLADPSGVVYVSSSGEPVAGAIVNIVRSSCDDGKVGPILSGELYDGDKPGLYTYNADGSVSMATNAAGEYKFFLKSPPAAATLCRYRLSVDASARGFGFPSTLSGRTPQPGQTPSCGNVVPSATAPAPGDAATYYLTANAGFANGGICEVMNNHIAVDPDNLSGLVLEKTATRTEASIGDFIDYTLKLTNKTNAALPGVTFVDRMPVGFAYVSRSVRFSAQGADEPSRQGPTLTFKYPGATLAPDQTIIMRYRLRIGINTPIGDAVNRAQATAGLLGSNPASARVKVTGGVFSDEAYLFGKVFTDCNKDGIQGDAEVGVPDVRLFLENGTSVITDSEGKWSLYGLRPTTHAVKVDRSTLPAGARLSPLDNRNMGVGDSRFADLKKGEWHKANFAIDNCEAPGVREEVEARRARLAVGDVAPVAEGEAPRMLETTRATTVTGEAARSAPASGLVSPGGVQAAPGQVPTALIGTAQAAGEAVLGAGSTAAETVGPARKVLPQFWQTPLESALEHEDNAVGFVGMRDRDVAAGKTITVRVKGPLGTELRLSVNGEPIAERQVGKRATAEAQSLVAWEFIGVALRPGENRLEVESVDSFGNVRGRAVLTLLAPAELARLRIERPETVPADPLKPFRLKLSLLDASGVPVAARTAVTLETDRGQWNVDDLNPQEPGVQVFVEGGAAEFDVQPPGEPGDARLRASAGIIVEETRIVYLPALRPLTGIGVIEGIIDLSKSGTTVLGAPRARDTFEAELSGFSRDSADGDTRAAGRAAFYFKGTIKGEYLLTTAYDSGKTTRDRLFRDIQPDEFYPVYGDASVRGFDAQSTGKFYVRIDKDRSYLLYGDFTTAASAEVRQLSQSNRALTGIKQQYDNGRARIISYASHDNTKQRIEEFPANGTSGPFQLHGAGEFYANSELVEVIVRDRNQRSVILSQTPLVRFSDYTIDPLSKRLLLQRPLPSLDTSLNPQSIRVTYEINDGGEAFVIAGSDVQVRVGDSLQVGAAGDVDRNPENPRDVVAATALMRLGKHATTSTEVVQTESDLSGVGHGERAELQYDDGALKGQAKIARTDVAFDNPGSTTAPGRLDGSARAEYKLDATTALKSEVIYSADDVANVEQRGASVAVQKRLRETVTVEGGLRASQGNASTVGFDYGKVGSATGSSMASSSSTPGAETDVRSVRARVTAQVPHVPAAQAYVEGEQDVRAADARALTVGGDYRITDKTSLYGIYEFINSLGGPYSLTPGQQNDVAMVGIDSAYMDGGQLYNEYRLADTIDGRSAVAALGVRNIWSLGEGLRLNGSFERTGALAGVPGAESTAGTGGFDFVKKALRLTGAVELRHGSDQDSQLYRSGLAYKFDPSWSMLARSAISLTETKGDAPQDNLLSRNQIGFAYRPVNNDRWNALARYEHWYQDNRGGLGDPGALDGPGLTNAHIVSAHVNLQPARGTYLTARQATKWQTVDYDDLTSRSWATLTSLRATRDLDERFDIGAVGALWLGDGGERQRALGLELGWQMQRNIWLSVGYNFLGVDDPMLTNGDYLDDGAFVRLRMKFDETDIGAIWND